MHNLKASNFLEFLNNSFIHCSQFNKTPKYIYLLQATNNDLS